MADVNMLKQRCDFCRMVGLAAAALAIVIVGWVVLGAVLPLWQTLLLMVIAAPVLLFMVDEHCLSWAYRTMPAPAPVATPEPAAVAEPEPAPEPVVNPEPEPVPTSAAEPEPTPAPEEPAKAQAEDTGASAPQMQSAPEDAAPDDLKKIKGVGPKLEEKLHDLGIFHYHQIAAWTDEDTAWVDDRLSFKGRIARDGWIDQAKALMGGEG